MIAAFVFGFDDMRPGTRRWHQLGQPHMLFAWLDDILHGAFLLYGALEGWP